LDGPATERDARLEHVDDLYDERRRLVRPARAQALGSADGPAVAAAMALGRLESTALACRRAARTVRTIAIKHA
jgi:hypothetical protein